MHPSEMYVILLYEYGVKLSRENITGFIKYAAWNLIIKNTLFTYFANPSKMSNSYAHYDHANCK